MSVTAIAEYYPTHSSRAVVHRGEAKPTHHVTLEAKTLPENWRQEKQILDNHDLFTHYYDIGRESEFMQKHLMDLPRAMREFYVQENVRTLLGEFVGKIAYTKITYELGKNGLEMFGKNAEGMYKKAVEVAGVGTREEQEHIGFIEVNKLLLSGEKSVVWLSPPKIASYGFGFTFVRSGDISPTGNPIVYMMPIRYGEEQGKTDHTAKIATRVKLGHGLQLSQDFLTNPLAAGHMRPSQILSILGISTRDLDESAWFESKVNQDLGDQIATFAHIMRAYAEGKYANGDPETVEYWLKKSLAAIYQQAEGIKANVWQTHLTQPEEVIANQVHPLGIHVLNLDMNRFASTQIAASDCALTQPTAVGGSGRYNLTKAAFIYGRPVESMAKSESWVRESGVCRQCGESTTTIGPCSKICVVCESKNPDFAKYLTSAEKAQAREIQEQKVNMARRTKSGGSNQESSPQKAKLSSNQVEKTDSKTLVPIRPHSTGPLPNAFAIFGLAPRQFE